MAAQPLLGDLDLTNHELQNAKLQLLGVDPTGIEGKVQYRTDLHRGRLYDGSTWRSLAFLDELAGAITVADTATIDLTLSGGQVSGIIVDASVGNVKLANMAANTVKANITGGAAAPTDVTKVNLITWLGLAPGDIIGFDTQVRTSRLDQMAAPTADVSMNSHKITSLLDGTAVTDAINLGQLQAAIEGRQWKDPVATSTTGALPNTPTYNSGNGTLTAGANAALAAQAGHTLAVGEDLLVQNQASTFQDGIYTVTAIGSGAAPWVLTRRADASTAAELSNATVMVEANDSTLRGKIYTQQNTLANLTASAQSYTVTGDNNVYTAGTGLTLSGGQFSVTAAGITGTELAASVAGNGLAGGAGTALSVNTDGTTLEISADALRIAASAAGNGLVGGGGAALAVGAGAGILSNANDVAIDTAVVVRKYSQDYGNGALTAVPITHSLGTKDVQVEIRRNSDDQEIWVPWVATSTTVVTINHDVAPTTNQYRVIVHA